MQHRQFTQRRKSCSARRSRCSGTYSLSYGKDISIIDRELSDIRMLGLRAVCGKMSHALRLLEKQNLNVSMERCKDVPTTWRKVHKLQFCGYPGAKSIERKERVQSKRIPLATRNFPLEFLFERNLSRPFQSTTAMISASSTLKRYLPAPHTFDLDTGHSTWIKGDVAIRQNTVGEEAGRKIG